MRHLSIILIITLFFSCKTEYKKVIESFPNGKVKIENVYPDKNDKSKYIIIEYYQNGQISFKGTVENKKFIGVKLNYYENGNLKEIDSILNPCPLDFCCCDGKVINYYSNGKLDQTYEIKDGIADGLVYNYDYDSSGNLNEMFTYKKGKRNGIYKSFYSLGKLYEQGTYNNDTLIDHIYYFEQNGDTMKIYYTWKGKEDFPTKKWLTNGQIFYATYLDSTYKKALYRWTDKNGKELERKVITNKQIGEWVSKEHKWLTPN